MPCMSSLGIRSAFAVISGEDPILFNNLVFFFFFLTTFLIFLTADEPLTSAWETFTFELTCDSVLLLESGVGTLAISLLDWLSGAIDLSAIELLLFYRSGHSEIPDVTPMYCALAPSGELRYLGMVMELFF